MNYLYSLILTLSIITATCNMFALTNDDQLLLAASQNNTRQALAALKNGANPQAQDNLGWSPLHLAAYNGNSDLIGILLHYNANLTLKDKGGHTPHEWAYFNGHTRLGQELEKRFKKTQALSIQLNRGEQFKALPQEILNIIMTQAYKPSLYWQTPSSKQDTAIKMFRIKKILQEVGYQQNTPLPQEILDQITYYLPNSYNQADLTATP